MFCTKCGKQLPEGVKFCTGCGKPIPSVPQKNGNDDTIFQQQMKNNGQPIIQTSQNNNRKSNLVPIIIFGVIAVIAVVCLVVVLVVNGNNKDQVPLSASSSSVMSSSTAETETPESVVEGYLKHFDVAVNSKSIEPIAEYMKYDSPIYKSQSSYVKKENIVSIQLDKLEIVNVDKLTDEVCVITTRESFYVQLKGKPREYMTEESKLRLEKIEGKWKMVDWADEVKVLNREER